MSMIYNPEVLTVFSTIGALLFAMGAILGIIVYVHFVHRKIIEWVEYKGHRPAGNPDAVLTRYDNGAVKLHERHRGVIDWDHVTHYAVINYET